MRRATAERCERRLRGNTTFVEIWHLETYDKGTNGIQDLQAIQKRLSLPVQRPILDIITRWRKGFGPKSAHI